MAVGSGGGAGGRASGILAGEAFVRVGSDLSDLKSGLGKARHMVLSFSKTIAAAGAGLIGIGGAALAPILASFQGAIHRMGELKDLSDRLGASTEDLSALGYAAEQTGASMEDVAASAKFLQRNLIENADEFAKLGLNADELRKMGLADQFQAVADAVNQIEDPAQRTAAAMQLMGRGGQSMLPMLRELRQLRGRAGLVGAVVSKEDAEAADRVGDALDDLSKSLKYTFLSIGASLLDQADTIEEFVNVMLEAVKGVREWIGENRALVLGVTAGAAALIALGAAFIGIGTTLALAAVAVGGFMAALSAVGVVLGVVFSPVGLGIAAIGVALVALTALAMELGVLEDVADTLGPVWRGLADTLGKTWQGITDALSAGDLKLAFKVVVAELNVIWKGFLVGLQIAWNSFKNSFVDGWHDIITEILVGLAKTATGRGPGVFGQTQTGKFIEERLGKAAVQAAGGGLSEEQIRADAAVAQAKRTAARLADLAAAGGDLANAVAALDAATKEARIAANTAIFAQLMKDLAKGGGRQQQAVSELAGVRGQFGGAGLGAALAVGDQSIPKKQLGELEGMNAKLGKIEKKIGGLAVE